MMFDVDPKRNPAFDGVFLNPKPHGHVHMCELSSLQPAQRSTCIAAHRSTHGVIRLLKTNDSFF